MCKQYEILLFCLAVEAMAWIMTGFLDGCSEASTPMRVCPWRPWQRNTSGFSWTRHLIEDPLSVAKCFFATSSISLSLVISSRHCSISRSRFEALPPPPAHPVLEVVEGLLARGGVLKSSPPPVPGSRRRSCNRSRQSLCLGLCFRFGLRLHHAPKAKFDRCTRPGPLRQRILTFSIFGL